MRARCPLLPLATTVLRDCAQVALLGSAPWPFTVKCFHLEDALLGGCVHNLLLPVCCIMCNMLFNMCRHCYTMA